MVHYGHSCLVPIDRTSGIKMLYVFVDIKIDFQHFVETVAFNFGSGNDCLIHVTKNRGFESVLLLFQRSRGPTWCWSAPSSLWPPFNRLLKS